MKCIILAAGYATRLYPLTENTPKPLLDIHGKTILELILDKVRPIKEIDQVYIISNHKFYDHFCEWRNEFSFNKEIIVLDDGTTNNDNRLGAVCDIQLVIEQEGLHDDVLVLAGDNIFDFELTDFVAFYNQNQMDVITVHELNILKDLQRTGVATVNDLNEVIGFEEKPKEPKSNLAVPPFYIYREESLDLIRKFIEEGNNPDAPGNFIPYLIKHRKMKAFKFEGRRYDIGTVESYQEVLKAFEGR